MPWEETENEISHRVRDPGDFQPNSFRRMTLKQDRPQVFAIIGKLKGETKTTVQALRFPKKQGWTMEKAKQWVKDHYKESKSIADDIDRELFTLKIPMQQLEAEITLGSASAEDKARRRGVTWYTGATVDRGGWERWKLRLSMNPKHVRMDRLKSGKAPVLDTHSDYRLRDVIGIVESASIRDGKGYADLRFSERPEVDPIWNDIQNGIIRNASVGVLLHQLKDITEENDKVKSYLAVDWEPTEISIVPIGADMEAGFKAGEERFTEAEIVFADDYQGAVSARTGGATMPDEKVTDAGDKTRNQQTTGATTTTAVEEKPTDGELQRVRDIGATAEHVRVTTIIEVTKACGLPFTFSERHIKAGTSIDVFRKEAIDERARIESQQPQIQGPTGVHLELVREEADSRRMGMTGALLQRFEPGRWRWDEKKRDYLFHKAGGQELFDGARQYVGLSLLDVGKECLAAKGIRWQNKNRTEIVTLAFQSTSDFPSILANVANKSLRAGYDMTESQWKLISARRTAPDFKQVSELTLDGSSRLEKVPESGEFKRGKLVEGKENWQLATYGKIVGITRQAIINDDLGAFTRTPFLLGQEVAMLEADMVIGIITANGPLADTYALFEAAHHKNLVGTGSAIGIEGLSACRVLLMTQKSTGDKPLNITPRFLLAPAAIGQLAEQYCSPNYQAVDPAKINPLAGRLTPIIEARLDALDDGAWYLFGDPNSPNGTVLIYAYLEGQEGPYTENRQGFDVDGVEVKIRHDFAAAAVDYRGAVKNPGV
jgi:hypothetical protein